MIQASAKGLMSGKITFDQEIEFMQIPSKYVVENGHVDLECVKSVLIVEKDTVF